mmetsp:Transcript_2383/g.5558  ORF Transcript_2383/g.5558 Transcript_2383/m.5558 type:complete len:343 (+) Transcript_2383:138-1166(+)
MAEGGTLVETGMGPSRGTGDGCVASGVGVESAWRADMWLQRGRPWFALYGMMMNRKERGQGEDDDECSEGNSPISLLPADTLHIIMEHCEPYTLGSAACVCKTWLYATQDPELWKAACFEAWPTIGTQKLQSMVKKSYGDSWKRLWIDKPRLRYDGIYVSRNTYIRTGIVEWRVKNPVHLVCYYRYVRFLPNGTFLYKTTPSTISKVAKRMQNFVPRTGLKTHGEDSVIVGRYHFYHDSVYTSMVYPGNVSSEIRSKLRLRSTEPARNDLLDITSLMSYTHRQDGGAGGSYTPLGSYPNPENEDDVCKHKRGMNTYVFVPWHEVHTSELNLGIDQMDYYHTG